MSRRCDEQGQWGKINITQCRRLKPKEAVKTGQQTPNVSITTEEDDSLTHSERVQRVYVACSWVAFFILLPTFIALCIVMKRNERFTLHKNLILAFILRILTLFIFHHGKMGDNESKKTLCNVFWLLNRYFAASEITWMLNEGIFLLRMLAYPFDNESYLWYYVLFGWGFSGVLTFCVYLPYIQFKIARFSESCWVSHSQTKHMLVLYVPLTIMLLINFGFAAYVIQMLLRKLKNSQSTQMNTIKKSAKAVVIMISLLGMIYLLTFYQPGNNPSYNYFVAVVYPLQGVMVCIFCVYLSVEFRESFRKFWMKWRYGILIETNSYSTTREINPGPLGEQGTSASVLHESSDEIPPRARSIASLQDTSRPPSAHPPEQLKKQNTQRSLLSRSSDLTKYRLKKVEPEPLKPVRVQSAGPEAWCPPTLQAATAWQEIELSENRDDPSSSDQGLENEGFSAKSESELSQLDNQTSPAINNTEEHTKESLTPKYKDTFSFSSQLFEPDTRPSTAEISGESAGASELPENETSDGETLTETAGQSISQDAKPSTNTEDSSITPQEKQFWDRACELATQRRRSRIEHNRVLSTDEDSLHFHQRYEDMQKNADEYRLAWIAKIYKGGSHENESDA